MNQLNNYNGVEVSTSVLLDWQGLTGLPIQFHGGEHSILEVQQNKAGYKAKNIYCKVQDYYIMVANIEKADWKYYSKSWHRAHGPKITIEGRAVYFYKGGKLAFTKNLSSFSGNYLLTAIVEVLKLEKVKVPTPLKPVQLFNFAAVTLFRKIATVSVYKRELAGAFVDYCGVHRKETYHAATVTAVIAGLKKKAETQDASDKEIITKEVGFELGFCETGMRSFCDDNHVDFEGAYSRQELREIATRNRANNCAKYRPELAKIGIQMKCNP